VFHAQVHLAWEAVRAWRGAAARARLRGMLAGLWNIPHIWPKRRCIQARRTISIDDLESVLSPPRE
jgi:hypothetical protein